MHLGVSKLTKVGTQISSVVFPITLYCTKYHAIFKTWETTPPYTAPSTPLQTKTTSGDQNFLIKNMTSWVSEGMNLIKLDDYKRNVSNMSTHLREILQKILDLPFSWKMAKFATFWKICIISMDRCGSCIIQQVVKEGKNHCWLLGRLNWVVKQFLSNPDWLTQSENFSTFEL